MDRYLIDESRTREDIAKFERPGNGQERKVKDDELTCQIQCVAHTFDFAIERIEGLRNGSPSPLYNNGIRYYVEGIST